MENPIIKKRHLNKFYLQAETSLCDTVYEEADYMSVIKMANPKIPEPNHIRVFFLNELRPTSSVCSHKHTSDEFKLFDISIYPLESRKDFLVKILKPCIFHRKFENVEEILREFYTLRLDCYAKRKRYLEGILGADAAKLSNQVG